MMVNLWEEVMVLKDEREIPLCQEHLCRHRLREDSEEPHHYGDEGCDFVWTYEMGVAENPARTNLK